MDCKSYFQTDTLPKIQSGDFLFCLRGSLGKFGHYVSGRPAAIASSLVIIRPNDEVLPSSFAYYLRSAHCASEIERLAAGAAQPNLGANDLKTFSISIPPLEEQKRIVAVLDAAFEGLTRAKENAEANLQNARELFESFVSSFVASCLTRFPTVILPNICENLDRQRIPITKGARTAGAVPYYGASGVVDHVDSFIFDEDLLLISEDGANLLARTYPIAFSVSGKTWVNNHAHVLRFASAPRQEFVSLYLNATNLTPYISGMAQPKLNQKALNTIPIPDIPDDKCERFVLAAQALRGQVDALEAEYTIKLADIADLRQSLLQKAFAGELT